VEETTRDWITLARHGSRPQYINLRGLLLVLVAERDTRS
jgi:hypothetical protein